MTNVLRTRKDLFDTIISRVNEISRQTGLDTPQAFGQWFAEMYYLEPRDIVSSDGARDGKIDLFFTTHDGHTVKHHVINSKYTEEYNKLAPPDFYNEVAYYVRTFQNRAKRSEYVAQAVKAELRPLYQSLYQHFDAGDAELFFITNCRRNDAYFSILEDLPVSVFHLDDLIQHLIDDLDVTMPRTPALVLSDIRSMLSADTDETSVPTSIVFARLVDFVKYMEHDPYDLLFARNVRVSFGIHKNSVNAEIRETFANEPKEFVFSSNGITILCEDHSHKAGTKELTLVNPRVVNGSQTLHSIRDVANPPSQARIMVRIIEIKPITGDHVEERQERRKEILNKISVRSNRQNPIKKWDLVSNDEFQIELYRFFRRKGLFYERREREWDQRSRQLRNVGIYEGPGIKRLAQLVTSFYWNKHKLGAAVAKQQVGNLFEGEVYEAIQRTPPELCYQIYLIGDFLQAGLRRLANEYSFVKNMKLHADLTLFAWTIKTLQAADVKLGTPDLTDQLDEQWELWADHNEIVWRALAKAGMKMIRAAYTQDANAVKQSEGSELPYANYFKNQAYVSKLLEAPTTSAMKRLALNAVEV